MSLVGRRHPTRPGKARAVAVFCVSLGVLVLAGCGVSTGGPSAIPRNQVPFNLLAKNPPTTTSTVPNPNNIPVKVYFADASSHLVPEVRYFGAHSTLRDAIDALLKGPYVGETNQGIITYLGNVQLLSVSTAGTANSPSGETVTLNLSAGFGEISGSALVVATGQLVLTVASFEQAPVGVLFQINGIPAPAPSGNGAESFSPVNALSFVDQVATAPATTVP